jgi:hypothetical protein
MVISASTAFTKTYVEIITQNYFLNPADLNFNPILKYFLIFMLALRIFQNFFIAFFAFQTVNYFIKKKIEALQG